MEERHPSMGEDRETYQLEIEPFEGRRSAGCEEN